jgi:hypothetical protein
MAFNHASHTKGKDILEFFVGPNYKSILSYFFWWETCSNGITLIFLNASSVSQVKV